MLRSVNIRRIIKCPQYSYSTISPSANLKLSTDEKKSPEKLELTDGLTQSKMVAAAFASLKNISTDSNSKDSIRENISSAKDVDSVLSFVERPYLSRPNALMVIVILIIHFLYKATLLIRMSFLDSYYINELGQRR